MNDAEYYNIHYTYWEIASGEIKKVFKDGVEPILWQKHFNRFDVYLAFSGYFYGTLENSGRFFHQVRCWERNWPSVISMFYHYGMNDLSILYARASEIDNLSKDVDDYDDMPIELQNEINDIELKSTKGDQYKIICEFVKANISNYNTLKK